MKTAPTSPTARGVRKASAWFLTLSLTAFAAPLRAETDAFRALWNAPEIRERIDSGIETNRKGYLTLVLTSPSGQRLENAEVTVEQRSHEFLFGANIFILGGFPTEQQNATFERRFTQIFNCATVPFYWKDLEPRQGHPRFAADSEAIYRRPPPDVVVEWCEQHGITMRGHALTWDNPDWSLPTWWPTDRDEMLPLMRKRFQEIADRYGDRIRIWDTANEVSTRFNKVAMPHDFAYHSFKMADELFPYETKQTLNFTGHIWEDTFRGEYSTEYLLIQNLLLRGAEVDIIGMQLHYFSEKWFERTMAGTAMTPQQLFRVLDCYAEFGLPIQVTELTLSGLPDGEEGDHNQALLTENFYRLWFSHPAVNAIIWWNLADGTAAPPVVRPDGTSSPSEDKWRGGLLDTQLNPKPAFEVLDRLINHEWHTRSSGRSSSNGEFQFKGFYGTYTVTVKHNGKTYTATVDHAKAGVPRLQVTLAE